MSNLAKSKPEQLSQEVQKLRDLCYRDTVDIQKDKNDLTENNILLSCNKCLAQILTDLEIEYEEEIMKRVQIYWKKYIKSYKPLKLMF